MDPSHYLVQCYDPRECLNFIINVQWMDQRRRQTGGECNFLPVNYYYKIKSADVFEYFQ